ncbi:hypothetical protein FRC00_014699, partial [Tulasnella sp. 408]
MSGSPKIPVASKSFDPVILHPDFNFPDADIILFVTARCLLEGQLPVHTDIRTIHSESGRTSNSDEEEDFPSQTSRERKEPIPEHHSQTTLFKVHKCVLGRASEVFADMFTIPQPSVQNTVDGLPIIYIHDDPIDFHNLINHIYNSEY